MTVVCFQPPSSPNALAHTPDPLSRAAEADNRKSVHPITYTAMHGVGHAYAKRAFEAFGLPPYVPTPEQLHPDPEFSTVRHTRTRRREAADTCLFFLSSWLSLASLLFPLSVCRSRTTVLVLSTATLAFWLS